MHSDVGVASNIGGVVGDIGGASIDSNIINVSLRGSIEAPSASNIGGIIGYNDGTWTRIEDSASHINISGDDDVGGLVGFSFSTLSINRSFSAGVVDGNDDVGGILGSSFSHTIVENSYSLSNVTGVSDTGGFIGYANTGSMLQSHNVFTAGSVTAGGSNVGGSIGNRVQMLLDEIYSDTDTSTQASLVGSGSSTNITGATTAQMQSIAYWTGQGGDWTDATIWTLSNSDYPRLAWE